MYWSYEITELVIYGVSDDLIEVEGDVRLEFSTSGQGDESVAVVGLEDGGMVIVTPFLNGDWNNTVKMFGRPSDLWDVYRIDRPGCEGENGDQATKVILPDDDFQVLKVVPY